MEKLGTKLEKNLLNKSTIVEDSIERTNDGKKIHILIVEDNAANFYLVARMLEELRMHCEWKTSGYEVVEYADTLPAIDLVLMDIMLPYEDGYAVMRKLRQSSRWNSTPVIAITALSSEEQMNKALLAGFDGFLGKPLNPDKFPEQIKRILSGEKIWELNK